MTARRARVLVVDDNPSNTKLLAFVLKNGGYEVETAGSAEAGATLLGAFRPQLILMDLQMPGVSGLDWARQLKADPATRAIPIVAVTAYAMKGDADRARAAGCDGYLTKPVNTRTLLDDIARHLPVEAPDAADPK
jgi:two-component system cell cycle response regulator DivK